MKKIYILILLITISSNAFAQNKDTKKADDLYKRLAYTEAAETYQSLLKKGKGGRYVYERVVKSRKVKPETVYNYAQVLKTNGKSGDYNVWMKKFAQMSPEDSRAIAFMKDPDYLPKYLGSTKKFSLTNLKDINTEYSEFGGTVINKSFYFSSARNTARKIYGWNEEPFLDIYVADIVGGTEKNADLITGDVNTKYNEGNVAITADGKRMYFDRNDYFKEKYKKSEEGISQIHLFSAVKENGVWKDIQPVNFNNSEYSFGQPALSPDGSTLYFVSDMPGGKGMSDIYKLDVFYAEANGDVFVGVRNIGTDINSPSDDFAFKYNPNSKEGYVSSNRKGGVGSDDIYATKLIAPLCDFELIVQVVDEITKLPLTDARVDLFDNFENKLATGTTDNKGFVTLIIECDKTNQVLGYKNGYEGNSITIDPANFGPINKVLMLRPIEKIIVNDKIVLNPIMFDYDQHNIKPQAAFELDKLVAIMKKYPTMEIKIESHTDHRGTATYNLELSNRRAASTKEYVISQGIESVRLTSEGYGKTKPLVDCGINCSEEENSKNRRSEFIINKQ